MTVWYMAVVIVHVKSVPASLHSSGTLQNSAATRAGFGQGVKLKLQAFILGFVC